jgi:bifunctional non-homologous end joining protein LigD
VRVLGAMQTPDGQWRVEAIQRGRHYSYRILHGDNVIDGLVIGTAHRLLAEAGGAPLGLRTTVRDLARHRWADHRGEHRDRRLL